MPTTEQSLAPIPECVLEALEVARLSGAFNMLDHASVIRLTKRIDNAAWRWLKANNGRYMEALKAMGARRQVRDA